MKKTLSYFIFAFLCAFSMVAQDHSYPARSYTLPVGYGGCVTQPDFEYGGLHYGIIDEEKATAGLVTNFKVVLGNCHLEVDCIETYLGSWENWNYEGDIVVPETVEHNEKSYTVIMIGYAAFYGCDKMTSISLPSTIRFVDSDAFIGCSSLNEIKFDNRIFVGHNIFYECHGIKTLDFSKCLAFEFLLGGLDNLESVILPEYIPVTSDDYWYERRQTLGLYDLPKLKELYQYSPTPSADLTISCTDDRILNDVPLYVPAGSVELYRNHEVWGLFKNIAPIGSNSIDEIETAGTEARYFNLGGVEIDEPTSPGIYLRRSSRGTEKIIIR